jgi:hypothetical protein
MADANDLTADQVRALATSLGLAPTDDDLAEVTHRLNTVEPTPPTP